ncbi:hypothetical protein [Sphingobacterium sp. UBA6645]|uniref:hypothetical protein n=1 Tax=Sphingobacterium sp. UBA6645 TaxID=1947511 RepID=UPI0025DF478F|nr:hypothetical protein [Sphingobacterium sp. UBA6645]
MKQNNIKPQELRATDLRIGNYIKDTDTNRVGQVVWFSKKKIGVKLEHSTIWQTVDEYSPIPLSEEVLLKCGAVLHGIEYIIKASALPVKIRFHSGIAYCEMGNVYLGDRIKYLHELQNLIYILCGKEIEVSWT